MPKAPSSPSTPPDMKPYLVPSSSRDSAKTTSSSESPTKSTTGKTGKTGRPWTEIEKVTLFDIAIKQGASYKNFEGVIEGRTGKQCYLTWHNTLAPQLRKSLSVPAKRSI